MNGRSLAMLFWGNGVTAWKPPTVVLIDPIDALFDALLLSLPHKVAARLPIACCLPGLEAPAVTPQRLFNLRSRRLNW